MKKPHFFSAFTKDPMIASVTPTSKHAVKKLCEQIKFVPGMVIVEYGPGNGVVSRELLARLPEDGKLILIERNPVFADHLRATLSNPRVSIFTASAEAVGSLLTSLGIKEVDVVLSSIPFTLLPASIASSIVHQTRKILKPDGLFLVFQFTPRAKHFIKMEFPNIKQKVILLNVPPLLVWRATA